MAYNPQTATSEEKWDFRMRELLEYLGGIPLTTPQRMLIEHHLNELGDLFKEVSDDWLP